MKALLLALAATPAAALAALAPAGAQTAERLYVMDCGHNSAKDQSIWSPGIDVGKPIEQADTCSLIKHGSQWLLWDTGYPDAIADTPEGRVRLGLRAGQAAAVQEGPTAEAARRRL